MKAMAALYLLLSVSVTTIAQNEDADKSKIMALETAWNLAEQHKDVKALDELLGKNLVYIDYDGVIQSKQEFLAGWHDQRFIPNRS